MQTDYQAILTAPCAALGVRVTQGQLTGIDFLPVSALPISPSDDAARLVCEQLHAYLHNPRHFSLPLSPVGTPFQKRVWQVLLTIPVGETLTYAELAQRVSSGPRAVANACGANPIPVVIPCHRVVAKHGIGGFMRGRELGSLNIKQWLLAHERGESSTAG